MLVGCYSLDLYCDVEADLPRASYPIVGHDLPGDFTGETRGECIVAARAKGWVVRRDATRSCGYHVRCPHHRATRTPEAPNAD